jgi:uncharacterized membrane protein YkvA (DUF1232 family)
MPIQITFELSDADLDYFRKAMHEAQQKTRGRDEKLILAGARKQAREMGGVAVAQFVTERLRELDTLTRMLEDADWKLEGGNRRRVLDALAYFAEPSDLVPDHIPGLGFLDDAIMVEIVRRELAPEIEAYESFCKARDTRRKDKKKSDPESDAAFIEDQRRKLFERIRERRRNANVRSRRRSSYRFV